MVKVEFGEGANSSEILGMWSAELEYVPFSNTVMAQGAVEFWLTKIENEMRTSLYDKTKKQLENYPEDGRERAEWLFAECAQAVLTIDQVTWTSGVTEAIGEIMKGKNKKALEEFLDFSNE
jgi:dynein heavy chain